MAKLCTRSSSITCRELSREWRVRFARVPQKRKGRQSRPKRFRNSSAASASGASVLREFLKSAKAADRGPKHFRNSSAAAASGASVLREFLKRTEYLGRPAGDSALAPRARRSCDNLVSSLFLRKSDFVLCTATLAVVKGAHLL